MNNLRKFNTENEYQSATLMRPSVSWVVSSDTVHFDNVIPVPTCEPTNPNVWVAVNPSVFDFSQKVYQLDLSIASNVGEGWSLEAYLYNSPNDATWAYKVSVTYMLDQTEGTFYYDISIDDSSMQNVYYDTISEGEGVYIDLCEILGSGFYLKATDVPSVEVCDQEECTEYECIEWDEETGECIEQGDACISTECTASHQEYPSVLV